MRSFLATSRRIVLAICVSDLFAGTGGFHQEFGRLSLLIKYVINSSHIELVVLCARAS